jgi:hypothetical protein
VLITNHVLGGALVGLASPGPVFAFGIGVVSHVAMDALPHWGDPDQTVFLRVAVVDGLVGLATMGLVARLTPRARRVTVVAGMLGACFPDSDKPSELFFGRSPFPHAVDAFHKAIQRESKHRMPQEWATAALQLAAFRALVGARRR